MIQFDNLVAIAYKTGFCGSLLYYLLAHSEEVHKYQKLPDPNFDDGTCHDGTEYWFKNLHDYKDSESVKEELWGTYLTDESYRALNDNKKLVIFRCHPNSAYKLNFIKNLKVLFVTHCNTLLCERWAYEKVYKPQGEQHFIENFHLIFKTNKSPSNISKIIKRQFLIRNINHAVVGIEQFLEIYKNNLFHLKLEEILSNNYLHYKEVCMFLNITAIKKDNFDMIINNYNSKQWKRF